MNRVLLIAMALVSLALTPAERKIVGQARAELGKAKTELTQAKLEAELASHNAKVTEERIAPLEQQIEASHANEQKLANDVQRYKPFYDQGHKLWGLGAIGLGIGILTKHLMILLAILVIGAILVWVASFFFPVIGVGLKASMAFIKALLAKISSLFKKKNP